MERRPSTTKQTNSNADLKSHSKRLRHGATPSKGVNDALLEAARMQWQFGDWENLASLTRQAIEGDPDRATLALLKASAHLQLGELGDAEVFLRAAVEWGCEERMLAQVLLAGASNVLGRIAAVRGQEVRALSHFKDAVEGLGGDERLTCRARSISEIARLKMIDQAMRVMKMQTLPQDGLPGIGGLGSRQQRLLGEDRERSITAGSQPTAESKVRRQAIVIAGMRHSGSTMLFNIVRLALVQMGLDFVSFYSEGAKNEYLDDPDVPLVLVKTHEFRDDVMARADIVLTTRRDLRDSVASAIRRDFPIYKMLGDSVEYAKYNRALHDMWLEHSDYEVVYESYMASPVTEIERLMRFLGFEGVHAESIYEAVASLPLDQYQTSLLSSVHITDPKRVLTFEDTLDNADLARINRDHAAWLRRYGYVPKSGLL